MNIVQKIFGTHSERELKRIEPLVKQIEDLRDSMQALSDEELKGKTKEFKKRLGEGETLDDLLPEAYAVVREALLFCFRGVFLRCRLGKERHWCQLCPPI